MSKIAQKEQRVSLPPQPKVEVTQSKISQTKSTEPLTQQTSTFSHGTLAQAPKAEATPRLGLQRAVAQTPAQTPINSAALESNISKGHYAKSGRSGEHINQLQSILNQAGANPPLDPDGAFGPKTEAAVRAYQQQNGLRVDGIVGPETLGAMTQQGAPSTQTPRQVQRRNLPRMTPAQPATPAPTNQPATPTQAAQPDQPAAPAQPAAPTPAAPTPAQPAAPVEANEAVQGNFATEPGRVNSTFANDRAGRVRQAEDILRSNGQWPPQDGRAYAIQIDQDAPPASASYNDRAGFIRDYNGQTAVYRAEGGRLVEQQGPLESSSYPGQFTTGFRSTPDVNGDGRKDIAHIRPGVYNYNTRRSGSGRFNPTNDNEFRNSARDINHDGVIGGNERNGNYGATGIQIHEGKPGRPSSVGCQTMPPSDYRQFVDAIENANTGRNSNFTYILVRRPNEQYGENRF